MRILVCLNADIESNIALNLLLDTLKEHDVFLNLSKGVGHKEANIPELQFAEIDIPFNFIFPILNDKFPSGQKGKFLTYEQISKKYDFPLYSINKINQEDNGIKFLTELMPDLIISIRYGQIFKEKAIAIPKHGIINLHSGILPNYKGVIVTFRAMSNDDKELGTTLHYINNGTIDTGDIIDIYRIKNDKNKSLFWQVIQLYYGGVEMIKKAINEIDKTQKKLQCKPQSLEGKYYSHPTKQDILEFKQKGYEIVDFEEFQNILNLYI
jgi:methionyl-tRNA formyltransferase